MVFSKKWSAMKYLLNDIYDCFEKKNFPTYQLWCHNILDLMQYLVFPVFWSHSGLLKIGQHTKSNLMIYNLSMFEIKIFCSYHKLWCHWDLGNSVSLEKCGRTVFKIVSPTDNFETTKNGNTLVARFLQYFPCLHIEQ